MLKNPFITMAVMAATARQSFIDAVFSDRMFSRVRRAHEQRTYKVNTDPASRECTRRRRQIARGMLTKSNGLVWAA